ncbi:DNA gyrase subunit A [Mycoplasma capricolum subsp. capricolum]|uniref:DNA topoisomerase (ATP-hydrolyzing) n=1 Tax=Mycoplasma capricolum subsp. capricolum 14232 TaxID=1188238 RepID=A0A084EQL2_MYCCA|nr:DNA gyrase subunit A [Mycoplasma capricolum]KEZ20254.1 DNA Gyrase, A subunit A [Mycoplasma capricolum subsp. capricolum 14232]
MNNENNNNDSLDENQNHYHGKISPIDISTEVRKDFLEYAMSVIVSRALPDLKDGLKPVHRRIIYAMNDLGITSDKPHKKSARIVGEVIGKYHPHGDSAVYETMVRMAQEFSYRYPLIDGHGNFGSIDGDGAAAMRYTEARLAKISNYLIKDIDMDTVPFIDNYDASEREPAYLTGYLPNLLVNGTMGIAVGMATSIPPHNLKEVVSAINAYIDNNDITIDEILDNHILGPDFPTGALMTNGSKMREGYKTGRGSVIIRAKIDFEENKKHDRFVVTEIPYQTNKAKIIEKIAELVKDKTIEGIFDIRDESNYEGIRIIIELKKDANPDVVLSKLYKYTALQSSFSINLLTLNNNLPVLLDLKTIIKNYVEFQVNVIIKRSIFEKNKLTKRYHILEALHIALDNVDDVINIIKNSKTSEEAKVQLTNKYNFDEEQNKAILDMRLQRLVGLERDKITLEMTNIKERLTYLDILINTKEEQNNVLKNQLNEIADKFGDNRRTELIDEELINIEDEELIPDLKWMILLSQEGYIRRINPDEFRIQKRGGRGVSVNAEPNDPIDIATMGKAKDWVLFFTNSGKVYRTKLYNIRSYSRTARGLPIVNFLNDLTSEDKITAILPLRNNKEKFNYLTFVTQKGMIKRTKISEFENINRNGKKAINLRENDQLVSVFATTGQDTIFIANESGKVIRIKESVVNPQSRVGSGVRALKLEANDVVVGAISSFKLTHITTVSNKGLFKKTPIDDYRISGRNGKGIKVMNLNQRTGKFKAIIDARETDLILIISSDGNLIKTKVSNIPSLSRNASGVKAIRLADNQEINAITLEYRKHGLENEDFEED